MTTRRAMELLMIERACVRMGSGMEWICGGYKQTMPECNRDCAHCELVQKSEELLEMYDFVIGKMIEENEREEAAKASGWKRWQLECDPRRPLVI